MTRNLKSYIPEISYAEQKHSAPTELCAEDFAIVDMSHGYRVLACRAQGLWEGDLLPKAWGIPSEELDFLEATVSAKRAVIQSQRGALLCFGELIESTGLLLVARPYQSPGVLLGALRLLQCTDCYLSPTLAAQTDSVDRALKKEECEAVRRLLYYLDRMLVPSRHRGVGLWQRCLLAAHFAGCRLVQTHPLPTALSLSRGEEERLTVFLLCTMLRMRETSRSVSAETRDLPTLSFRMEIECDEDAPQKKSALDFSFLSQPAFREFSLTETNTGMRVETRLHQDHCAGELHAIGTPCHRLRIFLSPMMN